jgi:hypothetical protein
MNTHTFVNEPSAEHLLNALRALYYSHDREKLMENLKDIQTPNTWENVIDFYSTILVSVASRTSVKRI